MSLLSHPLEMLLNVIACLLIGRYFESFFGHPIYHFIMFYLTAQQCPVIYVDNNVIVNGDTEEATYGNVVRFSCKSSTEVLSGSSEMYCDENGEWVGTTPKCEGTAGCPK